MNSRGVAYRMLASCSDADDELQDAYLRWHRGASQELRSREAWLVTAVTRHCIDRLRVARAELSSRHSIAFLVLLEQLQPDERDALLLHEVFETGDGEIAEFLGRSEVARRPRALRARDPDAGQGSTHRAGRGACELDVRSRRPCAGGDKVIRGRDRVACFVPGRMWRDAHELGFEAASVNGETALADGATGRLISVIKIRTDGIRILDVYAELNPDKRTGGAAPRG